MGGVFNKGEISFIQKIDEVMNDVSRDTGIILYYVGTTKAISKSGKEVRALNIEAYKEYADKALDTICSQIKESYGLTSCEIFHLVGEFPVGEPLVLLIIGSPSREPAFRALEEAVKRYKSEPTIWKKEIYTDGSSSWIQE
ncbi:MAG: molybdenum cofactor biosynthesis protein MoaE [Nitrososphaerota archaeon]|nr:molybdenum cofactor biosynthesis protein MoaE [Nitrososphaerota archaeon]